MIFSAESIEQPCSGIYTERIYDITTSPNGSIFLTDGYGVEIVVKNSNDKIETSVIESIPVNPDNLKFEEWHNHILKKSCCEFLNWENEVELYLDCDSLEWIGKRSKSMKKNEKQERYLNNLLLKGVVDIRRLAVI